MALEHDILVQVSIPITQTLHLVVEDKVVLIKQWEYTYTTVMGAHGADYRNQLKIQTLRWNP